MLYLPYCPGRCLPALLLLHFVSLRLSLVVVSPVHGCLVGGCHHGARCTCSSRAAVEWGLATSRCKYRNEQPSLGDGLLCTLCGQTPATNGQPRLVAQPQPTFYRITHVMLYCCTPLLETHDTNITIIKPLKNARAPPPPSPASGKKHQGRRPTAERVFL